MSIARLAAVAASVLLLPACEATEPRPFAPAEFRLESVGGSPVPATFHQATVLESASLTLAPGGGAIVVSTMRNLTIGDPEEELTSRSTGIWSAEWTRLTVRTPQGWIRFRIEEGGDRLRSEAMDSYGPGLDVLYEYVYRRVR